MSINSTQSAIITREEHKMAIWDQETKTYETETSTSWGRGRDRDQLLWDGDRDHKVVSRP